MRRMILVGALLVTVLGAGCLTTSYPSELGEDNANETAQMISNSESYRIALVQRTENATIRRVVKYNESTERIRFRLSVDNQLISERYVTPDRRYRSGLGERMTFVKNTGAFSAPTEDFRPIFGFAGGTAERSGRTEIAGSEAGVYTLNDAAERRVAMNRLEVSNFDDATVTTYARQDGRIVAQNTTAGGQSEYIQVTKLNRTVVEEPVWLDDAERAFLAPSMTVTFTQDGTTLNVETQDVENTDGFRVRSSGMLLQTTDGDDARVRNVKENQTLNIALVTDEYDVRGETVRIVARNGDRQEVVAKFTTTEADS